MGKNVGPFYRSQKQAYYCWIDGEMKSLGKGNGKRLADIKYRELLAEHEAEKQNLREPPTVQETIDDYLKLAAKMKPNSLKNRRNALAVFLKETKLGGKKVDTLTHDIVEDWLDSHPDWSPSSRRTMVNYLQAAINHQILRRRIESSPLKGIKKPGWGRREHVLSPDDQEKMLAAAKGCFLDIMTVLKETGARPSELCNATVERYADGLIVLDEHKEDESEMPRLLYLNSRAREVVERLIGERAGGLIFRNSRGEVWTPDTILNRFKRLRNKLGIRDGVFPYACRSRYITDALEKGVDPITVSELVGHKDMTIIRKHYARLGKPHLIEAAEKATRKDSK